MTMQEKMKLFLIIFVVSFLIIGLGLFVALRPETVYERTELLASETVIQGNPNAKVYLVEFSDFQCPACKAFTPLVDQMIKKYGDSLVFGYRHFPLPQHPFAEYAAQAFEAAHTQGKAWEMYTFLFANQKELSEARINNALKDLGINSDLVKSKEIIDKVQRDKVAGGALGIDATPTFFLNGKKLKLYTPEDLTKAVDEAMSLTSSQSESK